MSIAERVKILRKHLKMSQAEPSQKTGIPLRTLQSYESGERQPGIDALSLLASVGGNLYWLTAKDQDTLGGRLKLWRNFLGMNQKRFSEYAEIGLEELVKYENNEATPDQETLVKLSLGGVDYEWLAIGKGMMTIYPERKGLLLPEDLKDYKAHFVTLFDALTNLSESKRGLAIDQILARIKEIEQIDEMEKKINALTERVKPNK